jgi:hypothetical protein
MVRPLRGGRLDLWRCGLRWNRSRSAAMGPWGHPVPDVAAPAAKVFRIGANPGAWIHWEPKHSGARPSFDTRPGLRSWPLGRRSGCSSAEPYPPPRPFFIPAAILPSRATFSAHRASPRCHVGRSVPSFSIGGTGTTTLATLNRHVANPPLSVSTGRLAPAIPGPRPGARF